MCLSVSIIPIGLIVGIQGFNASVLFLFLIFVVTFYFSLLISQLITNPIKALTINLDKISKGQLDVKLEKSEIEEINNLIDSLNRIMASLKLAIYKFNVKKGEIFENEFKTNNHFETKQVDILSNIQGWAWETDSNKVFTSCSANVYDYLGYLPDEVIGKNIFDFITPEDVNKSRNTFNEAGIKKKPIKNLENWFFQKNGNKICVETNAFAFYDDSGSLLGFRGINTDVTGEKLTKDKIKDLNKELSELKIQINEQSIQQKKAKNRLNESTSFDKEKLDKKWIENENDCIFTFDINGNILDCNEHMYKKLGYSKDEMLSLNLADFDALETKKELAAKINIAKKNGVYSFKTLHKKKNGSTILVCENLQYSKDKNIFKCIIREDNLP